MPQGFSFLLDGDLNTVIGGNEAAAQAAGTQAGTAATGTDPAAAGQPDMLSSFGILIIWIPIIIIVYFLMMRPQRKREKQMKEMQASIKTGDNVITSGGFFGRVADVGEDCFIVEFGMNRGVRVPIQKSDVLGIRSPKTTPAPKDAPKELADQSDKK